MGSYDRYVTPDGRILNGRTLAMWNEAEFLIGGIPIPITQGSYNAGKVAASAGVHDGGGALDAPPGFMHFGKHITADQIVRALRRVGFAAWERWPKQGPWPHHIHCVALGDKEASVQAQNQMSAYLNGYNGLGHLGLGGKDDGPRAVVQTWEQYKKKHPGRFPPKAK